MSRLLLTLLLSLSLSVNPALASNFESTSSNSQNDTLTALQTESASPLLDHISNETLQKLRLTPDSFNSFQHRYAGKDSEGVLKTAVVDYIQSELTLEQIYYILADLKPYLNETLEKSPRAKLTVNFVRGDIPQEEVLKIKNIIDALEILNPNYQVHEVTEDTRLKMRELTKYFSDRYQTKNNKKWALVRFIVNGSVTGFGIWQSYDHIPAAIAVGSMLGAASGFIQYYYPAFVRFLTSAGTKASEYHRWYWTEVLVTFIIVLGSYMFNIHPESWGGKISEIFLISGAAMFAQGALDVYRSNRSEQTIRQVAIGTPTQEGENVRVLQRGQLLGIDVFKAGSDSLRKTVRPLDYKEREDTSKFFVTVSMSWAALAVIGLAGVFPGKVDLGITEISTSMLTTLGGFTAMGVTANFLSRNWNISQIKSQNPNATKEEIKQKLKRLKSEFWSFLFLDKYLLQEVKAANPDWSVQEIAREVRRLQKDKSAQEELKNKLSSHALPAKNINSFSDIFNKHACTAFFN